jgi:hypothetical protein
MAAMSLKTMGKSGKSQLALAAKKCRPIKSFFATKVLPPAPRSAKTSVAYCESVLESKDNGDEARKKTATRSVSTASTTFAAANATTTEESSEDDDDDDLIPSTATSFKRNRSMLMDPTEVFEAVHTRQSKRPLSVQIVHSRICDNLLSSLFIYLIHLMIQEESDDNMILSTVIQVTLCSTARLGASMSEYGWSNKGTSKKSPSEEVGDALSNAFAWPENAILHEWSEHCNDCCVAIMPLGVHEEMLVGMRWDIRQWMQGHALPVFYNERSHFQSRGDSNCLQGVGKARGCSLSFQHGRSWFRALLRSSG